MQIIADGVAYIRGEGRYRAWFDLDNGEYSWSLREFDSEEAAVEYGERVADRYNRIFGGENVPNP